MDNKKLNKKLIRVENLAGEKVAIFSVNGEYLRHEPKEKPIHPDFTMGGHETVGESYYYIPKGEIWIDENLLDKSIDLETTIEHELLEYDLMKNKGWSYEKAHEAALKHETKVAEEIKKEGNINTKSEPTASQEAQDHEATFEKIQKGEIKTAEDLGKSIKEDHKDDSFSKEIKELYSKKLTPSSLERVKSVLEAKNTKNPNFMSESDKDVLYNWEGFGGKYNSEESKTGGLHEFFTPYWLCRAIADIMINLGAKTDKVLDPATGTGRLLRYFNAKEIHAFEVNKLNADITQKLYSNAKVYNQAFETAFLKAPRFNSMAKTSWLGNDFDLVVSNPPYGEYTGEYKSFMPRVFTRFEFLFVALSMSLVKSGGYGIFVLPQSFMNNGNMYNKMKEEIMKYNTFVDAVRLPNGIFASTDIGVDLLILMKK